MATKKREPQSLADAVNSALTGWKTWRDAAEQRGYVTPVQALAVLLWVRENDGSGDQIGRKKTEEFVSAWLKEMSKATVRRECGRLLVPRDPVTRVEIPASASIQAGRALTPVDGWVMQWAELDDWLERSMQRRPMREFFESATAEAGASMEWTPEKEWEQYQKLKGDGQGKEMQRLAKMTGKPERTLRNRIKPFRDAAKAQEGAKRNNPFGIGGKSTGTSKR